MGDYQPVSSTPIPAASDRSNLLDFNLYLDLVPSPVVLCLILGACVLLFYYYLWASDTRSYLEHKQKYKHKHKHKRK